MGKVAHAFTEVMLVHSQKEEFIAGLHVMVGQHQTAMNTTLE
jgi:hypothetical protein